MTNGDRVMEITKKLEEGIETLFDSERYKQYLNFLSKFHNYSYRNSLLIESERPESSRVAGLVTWKNEFGRMVNKGEKGIPILAPTTYKTTIEKIPMGKDGLPLLDETDRIVVNKDEVIVPSFRVVYVFDISQTSGPPLPKITNVLEGNVENSRKLLDGILKQTDFKVAFAPMEKANGSCNPMLKKIVIKEGMSESQTIKTAIHEVAHSLLHSDREARKEMDKETVEVQAESVAYVVSNYFGLDTADYSFGYIVGWSSGKDMPELKKSLNIIQKESCKLINGIEAALNKDCEKGVDADYGKQSINL